MDSTWQQPRAITDLADLAAATAVTSEHNRRIAPAFIDLLRRYGLSGIGVPKAVGGVGVKPGEMLELIRAIAAGDGSAGWLAMIYATSSVASHWLSAAGLEEVFSRGTASIASGVLAPKGEATPISGGFVITGQWPFASGCPDADWIGLGAMVVGGPQRGFFLPIHDVKIVDTWDVMGLRATASHDVVVEGAFVPTQRTYDLSAAPLTDEAAAAFPFFGLLAAGIGAVTIGIAEAAIKEAVELGGVKVPVGSKRRLIDRPAMQEAVARAEALVGSAWAYLLGTAAAPGTTSKHPGLGARARLRIAASHAVASARGAVDLMYTAAGGSSLYSRSPLQRQFRDIHAATQHMMVAQPTWELTGRVLLGLESDPAGL